MRDWYEVAKVLLISMWLIARFIVGLPFIALLFCLELIGLIVAVGAVLVAKLCDFVLGTDLSKGKLIGTAYNSSRFTT